jgi:hypothetical protein
VAFDGGRDETFASKIDALTAPAALRSIFRPLDKRLPWVEILAAIRRKAQIGGASAAQN